jgi:hypothetical protein
MKLYLERHFVARAQVHRLVRTSAAVRRYDIAVKKKLLLAMHRRLFIYLWFI